MIGTLTYPLFGYSTDSIIENVHSNASLFVSEYQRWEQSKNMSLDASSPYNETST